MIWIREELSGEINKRGAGGWLLVDDHSEGCLVRTRKAKRAEPVGLAAEGSVRILFRLARSCK